MKTNTWRDYGYWDDKEETTVFKERAVETIIEEVINDAKGYFVDDYKMAEELKAKYLG